MGVYTIHCRACGRRFHWFSGNLDPTCGCIDKRPTPTPFYDGPAPSHHTGPQCGCARCEWQTHHYNLVHHVRVRGEYHV